MVIIYDTLTSAASVIPTLLVVALALFGMFKVGSIENLKENLRNLEDSLLPADTETVAGALDVFMQDDQCRRYIHNAAEQHRQLLTLEVYGMRKHCRQKDASDRLAEARKKLEAVGLADSPSWQPQA